MTSNTNRRMKEVLFPELRLKMGGRCSNPECPTPTEELQFAHVAETPLSKISRGRGRKERYYDIKKHPDSYRLMCKTCHHDFDEATDVQKKPDGTITAIRKDGTLLQINPNPKIFSLKLLCPITEKKEFQRIVEESEDGVELECLVCKQVTSYEIGAFA